MLTNYEHVDYVSRCHYDCFCQSIETKGEDDDHFDSKTS